MIEKILQSHLDRYPAMQIQDLYKLLHQAALGSEHAVSNPDSARNWLTRELSEMGQGNAEPLIDPISPDGKVVRVHLRPFIAVGHDPELLLEAFIRTANEYRGDAQLLERYWEEAAAMKGFSRQKLEQFFIGMKARKYPAVHHSMEYVRLYRPAYRVIAPTLFRGIWK
jgi:hypothetical protein